ncbi:MAG: hypothetical protein ACD_7C00114G0004 [uncultured bacterium]|nr:MAG: hypothetical protein ACD_7C00114G0004 [uncultured bacterium]
MTCLNNMNDLSTKIVDENKITVSSYKKDSRVYVRSSSSVFLNESSYYRNSSPLSVESLNYTSGWKDNVKVMSEEEFMLELKMKK